MFTSHNYTSISAVNDSRAEEGANGGVVVVVAGPKNCWKPVKPLFHHILHSNKNINNPSLLYPHNGLFLKWTLPINYSCYTM